MALHQDGLVGHMQTQFFLQMYMAPPGMQFSDQDILQFVGLLLGFRSAVEKEEQRMQAQRDLMQKFQGSPEYQALQALVGVEANHEIAFW